MSYFRAIWGRYGQFNIRMGIFLILLIGVPRFILVLDANATGSYQYTSLIFVVMWLLPFIFLNKSGRNAIGIKRSSRVSWLFIGFIMGMLACIPLFVLGYSLYGLDISNWFVYISNSYRGALPGDLSETRFVYFSIFAVISMIFSPIGEEFMYRGFIHQCFETKLGSKRASEIDSTAFALTHLAHFGIIFTGTEWIFDPIPAVLWVICMFWISRGFFFIKQKSGNIWGAVLTHAGFNLAMTYFIFYYIL